MPRPYQRLPREDDQEPNERSPTRGAASPGTNYAAIPSDDAVEQANGGGDTVVPIDDEDYPTGSLLSSWINITNTILGSGMLAMPSALAGVGLAFGILIIGLSGMAAAFGLFLLTTVAAEVGRKSSFFALSKITYPKAAVYFDLAIAVKCFGVSISYLIICGSLMPKVVAGFTAGLPEDSILLAREFWITVGLALVSPFCFLRRLDSLRYTSAFALMAVVYLLFIVVGQYVYPPPGMPPRPDWSTIAWFKFDGKFLKFLPVFVFAFTCHQNIFAVYNELVDNSPERVGAVITGSIGTAFAAYQIVGIIGYLTFGDAVPSNILEPYPASPLITGGQLALVFLMVLSYPLQCHPCRASLDKVISKDDGQPMSRLKWATVTSCIMLASYAVAILVEDLTTVLSLVGATGSTTICYILPGVFYYKYREQKDPGRWDLTKVMGVILAGFGAIVMVTSVLSQFFLSWNGQPHVMGSTDVVNGS